MSAKRLREESGYSLVEVMVSILILAIAIIPMVGMFDMGLNAATRSGDYDRARTLAGEKLEEIRALPYNKPGSPSDSAVEKYPPGTPVADTQGKFTRTVTTRYFVENPTTQNLEEAANSPAQPMMRISVTVTWSAGNSYTTTGFVASGVGS
jgi:prepilin-type N-terminal cleavage/methylation domain-containing protein